MNTFSSGVFLRVSRTVCTKMVGDGISAEGRVYLSIAPWLPEDFLEMLVKHYCSCVCPPGKLAKSVLINYNSKIIPCARVSSSSIDRAAGIDHTQRSISHRHLPLGSERLSIT